MVLSAEKDRGHVMANQGKATRRCLSTTVKIFLLLSNQKSAQIDSDRKKQIL